MPDSTGPNVAEMQRVFSAAPFIRDLGFTLEAVGPGLCETSLVLEPRHLQQDGFVHAGVQATMADHTAGAAGASLLVQGQMVLTASFTVHLLRAARGERLRCRARVLKPGGRLTVVESEVHCESGPDSALVAKATVTLAVVPRT